MGEKNPIWKLKELADRVMKLRLRYLNLDGNVKISRSKRNKIKKNSSSGKEVLEKIDERRTFRKRKRKEKINHELDEIKEELAEIRVIHL